MTAPDFTLPLQNGKGEITLSQFRNEKPVVLIFGSFT
jgi:peroxiredoxin